MRALSGRGPPVGDRANDAPVGQILAAGGVNHSLTPRRLSRPQTGVRVNSEQGFRRNRFVALRRENDGDRGCFGL